ncbi:hypothetical protein [uncultured Maribacter sp.]|uniref:hypothetical protein n=1 Tax=uncultured Maribacter sp. TaxID=431308 RepID=UPI00261A1712|nr:hypothetical protein [uncultured Maribacter sp.]
MEKSKHCELCDLQSSNLKEGIICSLTNKKGEFNMQCSKIKLDKKLKEKLFEINGEYEDTRYTKKLALMHCALYSLIGVLVIYLAYYISIQLLKNGFFSTLTITILVIGLSIICIGIGSLNFYKRKLDIIVPRKKVLDKLTNIYRIKYSFKSVISTDIMGIKETTNQLHMEGQVIEKKKRY